MSRQGLKDFVHAVEHSAALRRQLQHQESMEDVVAMAREHGFPVSETDFRDDERCEQVERWFANSWIS